MYTIVCFDYARITLRRIKLLPNDVCTISKFDISLYILDIGMSLSKQYEYLEMCDSVFCVLRNCVNCV